MTLIKERTGRYKTCELIEINEKQVTRVIIYDNKTVIVNVFYTGMSDRVVNALIVRHYWKMYKK